MYVVAFIFCTSGHIPLLIPHLTGEGLGDNGNGDGEYLNIASIGHFALYLTRSFFFPTIVAYLYMY